jgi:hypothetical protein
MNKYYSVISRAVADVDGSDPRVRRAFYEQAQAALMAEFARSNPPPEALQIDNEYRALNGAIRKIESEAADAQRADRIANSERMVRNAMARVQTENEPMKPSPFRAGPKPGPEVAQLVALLPNDWRV